MRADDDEIGLCFDSHLHEGRIRAAPIGDHAHLHLFVAEHASYLFPKIALQHALHRRRVIEQPEPPRNAQPHCFFRRPVRIAGNDLDRSKLP